MEKEKTHWIWQPLIAVVVIILFAILFFFILPSLIPEEDYLISVSFEYNESKGITPYKEIATRWFDCRDVAEDYWAFPKSYDNVFNEAYLGCNKTYPELFNLSEKDNEILLGASGNFSSIRFSNISYETEKRIIISPNYTEFMLLGYNQVYCGYLKEIKNTNPRALCFKSKEENLKSTDNAENGK